MNFLPIGGFDNANDSDYQEQKDCTGQQDQQTNPPACRPKLVGRGAGHP
jgi:hypothetical protein